MVDKVNIRPVLLKRGTDSVYFRVQICSGKFELWYRNKSVRTKFYLFSKTYRNGTALVARPQSYDQFVRALEARMR